MADLTQQDRIEISGKLAGIDDEVARSDAILEEVGNQKKDLENKDAPNKKFLDNKTVLINPYQNELSYLDGIVRTELTEQIIDDSARKLLNNSFFPNDPQTPLPSIADGVWKNFPPFSGTHAIGKTEFEVYPSTGNRTESDIIADINSKIAQIEAVIVPTRATGKVCAGGFGSCSDPLYSDQSTCEANGGTWTESTGDEYSSDPIVQGLLTELKTLIQEWEDILNSEKNAIPSSTLDSNATRTIQNNAAIADIDNTISIIDVWQAVQDFDITTSLPVGDEGTGCSLFSGLTEGDFEQAKLQPTTLQIIKDETVARQAFVTTRISQLTGDDYLGSIDQDLSAGTINGTTGLYGSRFLYIDMRINLIEGTLSKVVGAEAAETAQGQSKDAKGVAKQALQDVMYVSKFAAPALGTKFLNLQDASGFSAGDRVYVYADEQNELSGSIVSVNRNRVELTFNVPAKYTTNNNSRIYKILN